MITVSLGYNNTLILSKDDAMRLVEILEKAEMYVEKYVPAEKRGPDGAEYTKHVYPNEEPFTLKVISDSLYQMAKLAGKPPKE